MCVNNNNNNNIPPSPFLPFPSYLNSLSSLLPLKYNPHIIKNSRNRYFVSLRIYECLGEEIDTKFILFKDKQGKVSVIYYFVLWHFQKVNNCNAIRGILIGMYFELILTLINILYAMLTFCSLLRPLCISASFTFSAAAVWTN